LQFTLSGVQLSDSQRPLQHSPSTLQESLSEVHWESEQAPSTHEKEQQSGPAPQPSPSETQLPGIREHTLSTGSQLSEQQSAPVSHVMPLIVQPPTGTASLSPVSPISSPHAPKAIINTRAKVETSVRE